MKHLGRHLKTTAGVTASALTLTTLALTAFVGVARADSVPSDQVSVAQKPADLDRPAWLRKFSGSTVELGTYVGTSTFYTSGYTDPYVSNALFLRPTYDLGTRYKLSVNARLYGEEEYTLPDNPTGRRFNPYDIWLWLAAGQLHAFEAAKVTIGGVARLVIPASYESRYQHMVTGLALGPTVNRPFDFGPAWSDAQHRFKLVLSLSSVFTKYLYTSDFRGNGPGDTTGCRQSPGAGLAASGFAGPSGSESDRCGGPLNTNYSFTSAGTASLSRGKWSFAAILVVVNSVRYSVPVDDLSPVGAIATGRRDITWGILTLSYNVTDHFGVAVGLTSYQDALDARGNLRFPFFDLSGGGNANNFTDAFLSVNGTL